MSPILLLLHLTSSVWGKLGDETAPPVYEKEENDNITFRWESGTRTDMSLTNMFCFFLNPRKVLYVLYELINGDEVPESQHQQFAGRVQCDRDARREGRLSLHLFRLTAEDSGTYRCDLAANYDNNLHRWELQTSVNFVLNVTRTSPGDGVVSLTPKSGTTITKGGNGVGVKVFVLGTGLLSIFLAFLLLFKSGR